MNTEKLQGEKKSESDLWIREWPWKWGVLATAQALWWADAGWTPNSCHTNVCDKEDPLCVSGPWQEFLSPSLQEKGSKNCRSGRGGQRNPDTTLVCQWEGEQLEMGPGSWIAHKLRVDSFVAMKKCPSFTKAGGRQWKCKGIHECHSHPCWEKSSGTLGSG